MSVVFISLVFQSSSFGGKPRAWSLTGSCPRLAGHPQRYLISYFLGSPSAIQACSLAFSLLGQCWTCGHGLCQRQGGVDSDSCEGNQPKILEVTGTGWSDFRILLLIRYFWICVIWIGNHYTVWISNKLHFTVIYSVCIITELEDHPDIYKQNMPTCHTSMHTYTIISCA